MDKEKLLKDAHNEVYKNIKPRDELINKTLHLMKEEVKKEKRVKPKIYNKYPKPIIAFICLFFILIGVGIYGNKPPARYYYPQDEINYDDYDEINVNISGVVKEITNDGKKIRIDNTWVIITEDTEFSTVLQDKNISKEFKIGNYVEGFTLDDIDSLEVTAEVIYLNE